MASYSIKAPDGNTYSIDGPDGASDADVRAQVLKQHPDAGTKRATPGFVSGGKVSDTLDPTEGMSGAGKFAAGTGAGLTDLWGGIKGFAARHGLGDPVAEAAAQAEKENLDRPLTSKGAGAAGHFVGEVAPTLIPGAGIIKGASMLPKGLQIIGSLAGNTALGAAQGAAAPTTDPNADDASRAGVGALWGAGGEGAGRIAGFLAQPIKNAVSPYAQQAVDTLRNSAVGDKLRLLAGNVSDNPLIKGASDALAKVPWFGGGVNAAREANLGAVTEAATERTGTKMDKLLPQDVSRMWSNLEDKANQFRRAPDVPMAPVQKTAEDAAARVKAYADATSQGGDVAKLQAAAKAAAPTAVAPPPPPTLLQPSGVPFPAPAAATPLPKMLPATDVMDLRRAASEMAYKEADPVLAAQYKAYRDSLDDQLKSVLPQAPTRPGGLTGPEEFDQWRKQWSAAEEMRKAADKGLSPQGHLTPQNLETGLSERVRGGALSSDPYENLIAAANKRIQGPPGNENRALLTALMFGLPIAGGAVAKYADSPVTGTAAAASPFLASLLLGTRGGGRYLSGTIPGQQTASDFARLLAQQTISAGR